MRLLDLFCGDGGAGRGYADVGWKVAGVDIAPKRAYPFEHAQADALWALRDPRILDHYDAFHASPPCQAYSTLNAYNGKEYPDLIDEVRELLIATGKPYVIENVSQAPLRDPIMLCGQMFGLPIYRHRAFESNVLLTERPHAEHVYLCARNGYLPTGDRPYMSIHGGKHSRAWLEAAAYAMCVPWMVTADTTASIRGVCEAIPPAYTRHIGNQLTAALVGSHTKGN